MGLLKIVIMTKRIAEIIFVVLLAMSQDVSVAVLLCSVFSCTIAKWKRATFVESGVFVLHPSVRLLSFKFVFCEVELGCWLALQLASDVGVAIRCAGFARLGSVAQ